MSDGEEDARPGEANVCVFVLKYVCNTTTVDHSEFHVVFASGACWVRCADGDFCRLRV